MDFDGFFNFLRQGGQIPFDVQIGGFADRDYPFTSRGAIPYERSFSLQDDKVVVMGWPSRDEASLTPPTAAGVMAHDARIYPATLDAIRRAAQRFGILHRYHRTLAAIDNDLFFRIGLLNPRSLTPAMTIALQSDVCHYLSNQPPLIIRVSLDDISIAAYEDDRLPTASTRTWSLADPRVTGDFVAKLYA